MSAIIALPQWLSAPRKTYITRSGGKYTPDDVALRFAIVLRLYDTADSIRTVARNLVDKVCLEHQPNMKRLAREPDDAKVFDAAIKIVSRVCEMLRIGGPGAFLRNELPKLNVRITFTPEQLDLMKSLYQVERWTLARLSERYGISESSVSRRLKDMGVTIRAQGRGWRITDEMMDKGMDLRSQGMPWRDVEKTVGVAWASLTMAINRRRRAQEAKANA